MWIMPCGLRGYERHEFSPCGTRPRHERVLGAGGTMTRCRVVAGVGWLVTLALLAVPPRAGAARLALQAETGGLDPAYLDKLLAPVALYPDQLLAQMLLCSGNARKVGELGAWLKQNAALKGSELQEAAEAAGF